MIEKLSYELELRRKGYKYIAGVDEVGRGPLAGPVVATCVILDLDDVIAGIDDSKKLSFKKRNLLFNEITEKAICYGIGIIDECTIDEINILQATKLAMETAIKNMEIQPDFILCDAISSLNIEQQMMGIIKGDSLSYLIGAASILAKQTRDKMMIDYANEHPQYGFEKHKGYGTVYHREALLKHGPCKLHRSTFIKKILATQNG